MNNPISLQAQYPEGTRLAECLIAATTAGLRGSRLPDLGRQAPHQLLLINSVYDDARNKHAGTLARTRGRP